MSITCDVSHDEMSVEEGNVEKYKFSGEKWEMCCIKNKGTILLLLLNTCVLLNMKYMVGTLDTSQFDKSVLNASLLQNILSIAVTLDVFHADTSYFCHCQM